MHEIVTFWKSLTNKPTLQIISNIVNNNGNGFLNSLKHFFRYDWDHLVASYFDSPYNDGMLSDDGLFIYRNNPAFERFCKDTLEKYTLGELREETVNNDYEIKLYDKNNNEFANQTVYMEIGSKVLSAVTDDNGVAKFNVDVSGGIYNASSW